jgi:C-terminal processing protease CtpA/Prc
MGDVVLKMDGENMKDRIARLSKYIPASTPQGLSMRMEPYLLAGSENSLAALTVRDRANQIKEVKLPRKAEYLRGSTERTGEIVKVLPGGFGYADLERLETRMVDEMFEKLKGTKAIIFDLRGYPQEAVVLDIAPRLTDKISLASALYERPILMSPDGPNANTETRSSFWNFVDLIPQTQKWRYHGKTVALIDERAISSAESSGLFLEAANGTKFIGSPTVGADGSVTNFWVPGGILVRFTGEVVKHIDGRQLQRIGLIPDVEVRPTIKGTRDGRDEVLEKAIAYLESDLHE